MWAYARLTKLNIQHTIVIYLTQNTYANFRFVSLYSTKFSIRIIITWICTTYKWLKWINCVARKIVFELVRDRPVSDKMRKYDFVVLKPWLRIIGTGLVRDVCKNGRRKYYLQQKICICPCTCHLSCSHVCIYFDSTYEKKKLS